MAARRFSSLEICSGAGAQALGLERAGFDPVMLIDSKDVACKTVIRNRPHWDVRCLDVVDFDPAEHPETYDVDLLSGGLPRVKAAAAVGPTEDDPERNLLRAAIWLLTSVRPKALLLENVPALVEKDEYAEDRSWITKELAHAGYTAYWKVLNASEFGVPQNRKSGFLIALAEPFHAAFSWPEPSDRPAPTVGETLGASMAAHGWPGAERWAKQADRIGPALVGGSDHRGGGDLGPTGSKRAWAALGVDGNSLANELPNADFPADAVPKLTVRQAAMIQCIPEDWIIEGRKTAAYRQIGHAMPPPLAEAVGRAVASALSGRLGSPHVPVQDH
ncbi:DNA cytosine methyltransferase [Streptomyces polygonati]|uniref:DNA (cytosine-5-)-methyltransferase n=1 Tax=Streptomyces polygonati TaxID=1617087 RepID=A0ABV8I0Z9_9ACTN